MKSTQLLFLFLLVTIANVSAQNFEWAVQVGGDSITESARSVCSDDLGNVYIVGIFEDTVDFDPGLGVTNLVSNGSRDFFVQKLDHNGSLLWVRQIGGSSDDEARSIAMDNNGSIYITGSFEGTVDFDPGANVTNLTSQGLRDIFVQKLDTSGNFVWVQQMGGPSEDKAYFVSFDVNGFILITGTFSDTVDFDPGIGVVNLVSNLARNTFIQKLDLHGNFVWARHIAGSSSNYAGSIRADNYGDIYLCGEFSGSTDFDPGQSNHTLFSNSSDFDLFILKLNSNGSFLWVKRIGKWNTVVSPWALVLDRYKNIYITGIFTDTVDFDPGPGVLDLPSVGLDIFVQKLDSDGSLIWAKSVGSSGRDLSYSMCMGMNDNIFIAGAFDKTVDFDPGPSVQNLSSQGSLDAFILELDSNGNYVWAGRMGGTHATVGVCITSNQLGDIYTIGGFRNAADFDPGSATFNLNTNGDNDIFIQKMKKNPVATEDIVKDLSSFLVYPNPVKNTLVLELEGCQAKVRDLSGKVILISNEEKIDVSHLSTGTYIIEATKEGKKYVRKFLKE